MTSISARIAIALTACLSALPAAAQSNDAPNLHEAMVGRINVEGFSSCAFVAAGADLVMTAAHCVVEPDALEAVDPARIRVTTRGSGDEAQVFGVSDIAVHPAFRNGGKPDRATVGKDVAALRLDGVISGGYETVVLPPQDLAYVGLLPVAENATEFNAEACPVRVEEGAVLVLECARPPGTSGSPIFALVEGKRRVVGVVSAGGTGAGGAPLTFGTSVVEAFPDLEWMRQDRGTIDGY
mgnify:CR=1 FL=1